jgi:ABC-type ATPase with predicted acetyltransferase domain
MQPQPHERALVVGITGTGKTTLVRQRVAEIRRVIVWAPKGDFELAERCAGVDEAAAAAASWKRGVLRAVVVPDFGDDLTEQFEALCEVVWWVGGCELVVEECGLIDPRQPLRNFARLVAVGRERRITVTCVAQRAVQVPTLFRSQVSRVTTFRQTMPVDVSALCELIGPDAERVPELPRFHFLDWGPDSGTRSGRIHLESPK